MSTAPPPGTIVSEIEIAAPAAAVFAALTDPQQRLRWWTAGGRFTPVDMQSDLRPGGAWSMRFDSNGRPTSIAGTYRAVEPPHLVEFTWLPSFAAGTGETLVRIELREEGGRTHVRLIHSGFASDEARASHRGWPELLAALRGYCERAA
jgi:uncharacterized protein YndB with AHSA1/START domain